MKYDSLMYLVEKAMASDYDTWIKFEKVCCKNNTEVLKMRARLSWEEWNYFLVQKIKEYKNKPSTLIEYKIWRTTWYMLNNDNI